MVNPTDRDMPRFLWFKNIHDDNYEIVQYRFARLVFGLTSSPAILNGTIQYHLDKYKDTEPIIVPLLSKSLYVDDLSTGCDNVQAGFEIYNISKQIFNDGGFNLRKRSTNSTELRNMVSQADKSDIQESNVKILGLAWDVNSDEFQFEVTDIIKYIKSLPSTKRSVLKVSAKIFDPLGLLSPYTVQLKMLFQKLCEEKMNWDDNLSTEHLKTWNQLLNDFNAISNIRVPRCYFSASKQPQSYQLHGFSDASISAYSAVIYLRASYEDGETEVRLVASKTRVSPIKKQTIPRLELLGATILARLMDPTISTLKFPNLQPFYWTDSYTALCWIKNNRQWKQYVQHRVTEIRELSTKENWNFCPGSENPADKPSRGCTGQTLVTDDTWWTGPVFLYKEQSEWPTLPTTFSSDSALEELVKNPIKITHSLAVNAQDHPGPVNLEEIFDIQRYGSKQRLLCVTALVLKFTQLLKENQITKSINAQNIHHAEQLWLKTVQLHSFQPEFEHLRDHEKSTPYVKQFRLYLDQQGLIRCQSRIGDSNVCEQSKRPYLLPAKHCFTKLIIQDAHHNVHHNGIRETLNLLRESYWIIRGRETIKKILRRCIVCRKLQGHSYSNPPIPDLPADRVSSDPPFTNTGLDFAGPLHISDLGENSKTYVCLFTCASTRAVHFELTRDLSVQSFLLAFRRFSSRRGLPSRLLSDNAKTFKCAQSFISKILRSEEISNYFVNKQVIWDTIVEKAPWWGGFWERLVGSLKRCLKKTIGRSTLKFEELRTLLVEIETTLNNRPLTYVYDDQNGVSYALTPADLLYGRRIATTPSARQYDIISTNQVLAKRAKYHFRLVTNFTNQWKKEYLTSLLEYSTNRKRENTIQMIKLGDIVILKNDNSPRIWWKLAKVVEVISGRDNFIRSAKVQVLNAKNTNLPPTVLTRPIQHLIPLEVNQTD